MAKNRVIAAILKNSNRKLPMVHLGSAGFNQKIPPILCSNSVTEKRTLVDFRRGPLGPYFDRFAAHLKERGYVAGAATEIFWENAASSTFF